MTRVTLLGMEEVGMKDNRPPNEKRRWDRIVWDEKPMLCQ
jgi:hypothetical protein